MNTDFIFELTTPVKYHSGGEEIEGKFITLYAPSYKQMDKCIPLKQAFYRAAASINDDSTGAASSQETSSDDAEMTPEGLMSLFYQSDEDMVKIMLYGVELFKSPGIAKIDGTVSMTQPLIEKMSQDDLENMLGGLLINFILYSALSKNNTN